MYKGEKAERRATIRFIIGLLKGMSIVKMREALEAVVRIAYR